jgi:hypothetical protein
MNTLQNPTITELEMIRDITFNQMKNITFAHARAHWR